MLTFPEAYFQDEYREDFHVDATMKTVWAAELEVLNEIDTICNAYDLIWYMAYGSLLGAVRHQGFIPWDDDMDIWMPRADYQRFLAVAGQELPKGYRLRSPLLEDGYPEFQACVVNSDSISIEPEHLKRFHGCPFVVGIDIFPLDALPNQVDNLQLSLFKTVRQVALMVKEGRTDGEVEAILRLIEEKLDVTIGREYFSNPTDEAPRNDLVAGLWGLANEIAAWHEGEADAREVCMYLDYLKYGKKYQKKWFGRPSFLSFENFSVPAPQDTDSILRVIYGDYTVRVRSVAQHDYPFYKKQLEELREYVKRKEAGEL